MANTFLKKNKKGDEDPFSHIASLIIVLLVIITVLIFLFSSTFSNSLMSWFRNLPGYHENTQTNLTDISYVQLPQQAIGQSCENIIGGIVTYSPDKNYGPNFVDKNNNLCIAFSKGNCEFVGIYFNDPDGKREIKYYNKDLGFDEVIGHIDNDVIKLDSKVFDLNSDFSQRLRIEVFNVGILTETDLHNLRQAFLYLDGSRIPSISLWLCKTKEEFNSQVNYADGQAKFKLAWPNSVGKNAVLIDITSLNPSKSGKYIILDLSKYINSDDKKIALSQDGWLVIYDPNAWIFKFGDRIGFVTPDDTVWFTRSYLNLGLINQNMVSLGVVYRDNPTLFYTSSYNFGYTSKTYEYINNGDKTNAAYLYETNLKFSGDILTLFNK